MNLHSKIYIAGHRGMVGSAIVRLLKNKGYHNQVMRPRSELDLLDQKAVHDFFEREKPDYVFLAAAKVGGIVANNTFRGQFLYENLQIQNNIIHYSFLNNVKKLLFLGSSCIYPKHAKQPIKEEYLFTGPLEPTNEPYAIAKIAGIKMCEAYRAQYGCNFISVMPTNLYGPNDNYDLETSHVLAALIRKFYLASQFERDNWDAIRQDLKKYHGENLQEKEASKDDILKFLEKNGILKHSKESQYLPKATALSSNSGDVDSSSVTVTLWGTGTPRREFLHVDDLADACLHLMQHYDGPEFFNIGTGNDITIAELAQLIAGLVGFNGRIQFDSHKPDGTPRKLLDVSRINAMGWQYSISLEQGLRHTLEAYLA